MDAAILTARNRWRARYPLGRSLGGYPLYLVACGVGLSRQNSNLAAADTASALKMANEGSPSIFKTLPIANLSPASFFGGVCGKVRQ